MDHRRNWQFLFVRVIEVLLGAFVIASPLMAAQTISCGQTVTGTLSSASDFSDYSFIANKDEVIIVSLAGTTSLFIPSADVLTPTGSIGVAIGSATSTISLPISTTYTIRMHGPSAGGFVLGLYFATGRCGAAISCGSNVSNSLDVPAQQAPYTFDGETGQVLVFSAAKVSGTITPNATLYGPDGKTLGNAYFGSDSKLITLAKSGRHTILVRDVSGSGVGTFGMNLQSTDGQCGAAYKCGETRNGSIDVPGFKEACQFDAVTGQVINVGIKKSSGSLTPVASLYGPKGDLVASSGLLGKITNASLMQDGHYTILVQAFMHASTGGYGPSTVVQR